MVTAIVTMCVALVVYGAAPHLWLAAIGLAGCGYGYGCAFTTFAGVAQTAATDEMRGRVLAVNTFVLGSLYPIGALVQGTLADGVGLRWVTAGSGVVLLTALVVLLVSIWRRSPAPSWPSERVAQRLLARRASSRR
jgi:MFS family permease